MSGLKKTTYSMFRSWGLKRPTKRAMAKREQRKMTDNLDEGQVGEVFDKMGQEAPDMSVFKKRRKKGGIAGLFQQVQEQQGLGG